MQPSPDALPVPNFWVTASAVQPTFLDSGSFNVVIAMVVSWGHPTGANLGGGLVWDVAVQASTELSKVPYGVSL